MAVCSRDIVSATVGGLLSVVKRDMLALRSIGECVPAFVPTGGSAALVSARTASASLRALFLLRWHNLFDLGLRFHGGLVQTSRIVWRIRVGQRTRASWRIWC